MYLDNPVESLAAALHAACLRDLPEIVYQDRDWEAYRAAVDAKNSGKRKTQRQSEQEPEIETPLITKTRRPTPTDCEVILFPQIWSSTALGFGGLGGAAMSAAYTVVVACAKSRSRAVYFGSHGGLAYLIPFDVDETAYRDALHSQNMPHRRDAKLKGWLIPDNK